MATVTDTPGAEGVEFVPELKKFYTSNAYDNTIGVVDMKQMKVVKKLKTEAKPDGSAYTAPFHKLYVSDERGKAEAIVDVNKDEIIKTLHFDSETGMPQYDPVARKVYVNLQDENIFAIIDPASDTGETVRLTWTGPTNGTMGSGPADANGNHSMGPVVERDPPGNYQIIGLGTRAPGCGVPGTGKFTLRAYCGSQPET